MEGHGMGKIRFFNSFRAKILLFFIAAMIFVSAVSDMLIYRYASEYQLQQLRKRLMNVAKLACIGIDPSLLMTIPLNKEGEASAAYMAIEDKLKKVRESVPVIKYIYVLKGGKDRRDTSLTFLVDVGDEHDTSSRLTSPGDKYDASRVPAMMEGFEKLSADRIPVADAWGDFLSAYAPIQDNSGKPFAVLGVDMRAEDVGKLHEGIRKRLIVVFVLGMLFSIFVGILISGGVSRKVNALKNGVERVSKGELDYTVEVKGRDEISELARHFNKMSVDLKQHIEDLKKTTAEKERLVNEIAIARNIQESLLPDSVPEISGIDIAVFSLPARIVGGDFYDFIPLENGKWGLVIADVSGKGVPAALYMALSKALIRSSATTSTHPEDTVAHANRNIFDMSKANMFVTVFYSILDPNDMTLVYANAGHNPPFFMKNDDGNIIMLEAHTAPLGIVTDLTARSQMIKLNPGDLVIFYTDGITEAENTAHEQYDVRRLSDIIIANKHLASEKIIEMVNKDISVFVQDAPQHDDMTMIVIKAI